MTHDVTIRSDQDVYSLACDCGYAADDLTGEEAIEAHWAHMQDPDEWARERAAELAADLDRDERAGA